MIPIRLNANCPMFGRTIFVDVLTKGVLIWRMMKDIAAPVNQQDPLS